VDIEEPGVDLDPMTYAQSADLATDPAFARRVQVAAIEAAIAISSEAPTDGRESYTGKRVTLAQEIIRRYGINDSLVWAVVTNSTISAAGNDCSDSDIQFVVSSVWDAVADVVAADKA
jgi:hypothetical protein